MRTVLWVLVALAAFGFWFSFAMEGSYARQSRLIQIVRRTTAPDPLPYESVGEPSRFLVSDPSVLMAPFKPGDPERADEAQLKGGGVSLIPLEQLTLFAYLARVGSLVAGVICLLGLRFLRSAPRQGS